MVYIYCQDIQLCIVFLCISCIILMHKQPVWKMQVQKQVKSPSSQRKTLNFTKWPSYLQLFAVVVFPSTPTISSQFTPSLSSTLPHPRLTRSPFGSFITGLLPLSGDDHLSSTSSHNRLVNALIAFSLCVGYTGRGSIIS